MSPTAIDDAWEPMGQSLKQIAGHPLNPITESEILGTANLLRSKYPEGTNLHFKAITLEEPEKAVLVPYLQAEHNGGNLPKIDRKIFVSYYIRNTVSKWRKIFGKEILLNI